MSKNYAQASSLIYILNTLMEYRENRENWRRVLLSKRAAETESVHVFSDSVRRRFYCNMLICKYKR
jgi:hypothetical protein